MIREQMIEKQKQEIVRLKKSRAHIPVMKVIVGLSDELINEMLHKIDLQISRCEMMINQNQPKELSTQNFGFNVKPIVAKTLNR